MGWTVIKEDEDGNAIETLSGEFKIPDSEDTTLNLRILKYLDPYGDTTFNAYMFEDLILDLIFLKSTVLKTDLLIDKVIALANECDNDVHVYLKFYGD